MNIQQRSPSVSPDSSGQRAVATGHREGDVLLADRQDHQGVSAGAGRRFHGTWRVRKYARLTGPPSNRRMLGEFTAEMEFARRADRKSFRVRARARRVGVVYEGRGLVRARARARAQRDKRRRLRGRPHTVTTSTPKRISFV